MNNTFLFDDFHFFEAVFNKGHYTDNRKGCPMHYIALLLEGTARLISKSTILELSAGDVFYIPMDLPYESFWYGEPVRWYSYGFTYFPENRDRRKRFKLQKIDCDQSIKGLLSAIERSPNVNSSALGSFYTALGKLLPMMSQGTEDGSAEILIEAKNLIKNDPGMNTAEIAEKCHISVSTLFLIFKRYDGKTPNDFKHEILCKRAVALLTTTDKSVQEISDMLCFSSTSYFRKVLYAATGKTPRQIRNENPHI